MNIKESITLAGGRPVVAKACGVSRQAIQGWIKNNRLPFTEYTGKTSYAKKITKLAILCGGKIKPHDLCPGATQYMVQSEPVSEEEHEHI